MKTLNFNLTKKLNDLGLLDNIETEYTYQENYILKQFSRGEIIEDFYNNGISLMQNKRGDGLYNKFVNLVPKGVYKGYITYKTLTLEELGEFFKNQNFGYGIGITTYFNSISGFWESCYTDEDFEIQDLGIGVGKTQIESMEKLLKYLLDNNLLGKN